MEIVLLIIGLIIIVSENIVESIQRLVFKYGNS